MLCLHTLIVSRGTSLKSELSGLKYSQFSPSSVPVQSLPREGTRAHCKGCTRLLSRYAYLFSVASGRAQPLLDTKMTRSSSRNSASNGSSQGQDGVTPFNPDLWPLPKIMRAAECRAHADQLCDIAGKS